MSQNKIIISSMGHYFPPTKLENKFFESLNIDTNAQWIEDRVGIKSRHSVINEENIIKLRNNKVTLAELFATNQIKKIEDMCAPAWDLLVKRSKQDNLTQKVGQVICGTSIPDWDIPANACVIANKVNIDALAFDINSACSSFVVGLHVSRQFLKNNEVKKISLFNPERYSTRMNFADRGSCVLFGDGASAAVVENVAKGSKASGLEVIDTVIHSNPSGYGEVSIPYGQRFRQNGANVQKFAITKTISAMSEILERNNLEINSVRYFIGHQANFRMLSSVCVKQGIQLDKHLHNVIDYGNQGAAGAANVLSLNWDLFKKDQLIILAVVGSGLTWGAALLRKL